MPLTAALSDWLVSVPTEAAVACGGCLQNRWDAACAAGWPGCRIPPARSAPHPAQRRRNRTRPGLDRPALSAWNRRGRQRVTKVGFKSSAWRITRRLSRHRHGFRKARDGRWIEPADWIWMASVGHSSSRDRCERRLSALSARLKGAAGETTPSIQPASGDISGGQPPGIALPTAPSTARKRRARSCPPAVLPPMVEERASAYISAPKSPGNRASTSTWVLPLLT